MNVSFDGIAVTEKIIQYGDLFQETEDGTYYLLVERPKIALISLSGKDFYEEFGQLDEAISNIKLFIKDGELIHLTQDQWQFQLKRK